MMMMTLWTWMMVCYYNTLSLWFLIMGWAGRGMVASVQELLQCLETSSQMSSKPFPSHLFALLFFVIHSPHPVVCGIIGTQYMTSQLCSTIQGRSILTFFWFILRTAGLVVPSFNLVKSFQLPGYLPPRRVSECVIYIYYVLFNMHYFFCSACHHKVIHTITLQFLQSFHTVLVL